MLLFPGTGMTILAVSTAAVASRSVGNELQIQIAGMTGITGGMCLRINTYQRIVMAGLTCEGQVHHVARSMINVMAVQVKAAYTVVNFTMTFGTVTSTAASCWYQGPIFGRRIQMTGTTGVMDQVVTRRNK